MRYRILIQNRSNKDKFVCQFTFESNNINEIISRIKKCLDNEITERSELLKLFINRKKKNFINQLIEEIPNDLIDWASKGKDISKEEFLENEIYFEVNE